MQEKAGKWRKSFSVAPFSHELGSNVTAKQVSRCEERKEGAPELECQNGGHI